MLPRIGIIFLENSRNDGSSWDIPTRYRIFDWLCNKKGIDEPGKVLHWLVTNQEVVSTMANDKENTPYTIQEAAKLLGIGRNTAYEAAKCGDIPAIRIRKRLLVPREALDRLISTGRAA